MIILSGCFAFRKLQLHYYLLNTGNWKMSAPNMLISYVGMIFLPPLGRAGEDRDLRLEQIRICISTGNIEKLSYCTFSRAIWSSNNKNHRLAFGWSHSLSQSYSFYSCLFYIMPLSLIIITL